MSDAFKRALLELLRIVEATVVAELLIAASTGEFDSRRILLGCAIAALKFVDRLLHEKGMEREIDTGEDSILTTGLSPVDMVYRQLQKR